MRNTNQSAVGSWQSIVTAIALASICTPAYAQLGGILNKAQQARDAKSKFDDLNVTEDEGRKIARGLKIVSFA